MHLALAIGGCTLDELDERMGEAEFRLWIRYANEFFLPHRRAELQAAQTALLVAVTGSNGKRQMKLADFLVTPAPAVSGDDDAEQAVMALGAMASARVYRLSQGRKRG